MLHFRKDGSIAQYQSFVRYYTLKQWMKGETSHLESADAPPSSYIYKDSTQLDEFFSELEVVLKQREWSAAVDKSYAALFGARGAAGTGMLERSTSSRM